MRIGIITIHHSTNYGASLQSWGLYKYLCDEGFECEIIDLHRPVHSDYKYSKKYKSYRQINGKTLKQKLWDLYVSIFKRKSIYLIEKNKKIKQFNNRIKLSRAYKSIDELYANPPQYDVYITGSDQVWNPSQPFCIEPYFLTFVNNPKAKKISYASSIGISELTETEASDFRKWLSAYNAISVREYEGKELLSKIVDKPIEIVADPTFLVGPDYWRSIALRPKVTQSYILVFRLQRQEIIDYSIRLGKQSEKKVIVIPDGQDTDGCTILRNQGLEEYLGWFAHADMVITDSFHGTVFSILMGAKNFFSYIHPTNQRGSRLITLLKTFNVSDHLLKSDLSLSYDDLMRKTINRDTIYTICLEQMYKSRCFLKNNIKS